MNRTLRHGTSFQKIGALCAGVTRVLARGVALVLAASLATGLVPHRALAAPGDITTVAGGLGQGPGLNIAQTPSGVAVKGTLVYIADSSNHVVRRLDTTSGNETVVAGNGGYGFSGDGGPATAAQLYLPNGVALDGAGDLFIADTNNQRIRRVDAVSGVITTVAGNGGYAFSGDGGLATAAQLANPVGVALDGAGDLFILDRDNQRIRRVDAVSGVITTTAQFASPTVALDGAGDLFVAVGGNRIGRVDAVSGVITTVAGNGSAGFSGDGGVATAAQLNNPVGVALDGAGDLFIADQFNQRIRRVDAVSGVITTVAGNGSASFGGDGGLATAAQLFSPSGVALDAAGDLFIVDLRNSRIRRVDAVSGVIMTVAGNGSASFGGDGGPATAAQLWIPPALRTMARATCSSPTTATAASGGSTR